MSWKKKTVWPALLAVIAAGPLATASSPQLLQARRHALPLLKSMKVPEHTYAAAFSPDGRHYAVGGDDNLIRLWDRRTGVLLHPLRGHTHRIGRLTFLPDGCQ